MDRKKFEQKGHAYKHSNLKIMERLLHPNYEVAVEVGPTSETGRLVIFKLLPKSGVGPRFEGRWDDKQEELDLDVFDASNQKIRGFKAGTEGYSGHHNGKASFAAQGRTYTIKVTWPGIGTIFDGDATFAIHRRLWAGSGHMRIN